MVEAKCIEVDNKQTLSGLQDPETDRQPKPSNEQWQALVALHRTLLHEHHDFFLASQCPSASPALRRLAVKYTMPARMWRHGIHSFLELLRHRLPDSLEHMLAFIYLAYSMMTLLYEAVPSFEDTWIECLGDLARYRIAIEDEKVHKDTSIERVGDVKRYYLPIEDDDIRDREVWVGVSRSWFNKAAEKSPTNGRLYHHLAILARPNALYRLFYYMKALTCVRPFQRARDTILTLVLGPDQDIQVGRMTAKWKEKGASMAVTNIAALFEYGIEEASCGSPKPAGDIMSKTGDVTNTDAASKTVDVSFSMGVTGTEVASGPGVVGWLSRSLWGAVTGAHTLFPIPSSSARRIRSSRACALALSTVIMAPVMAVAVEPGDNRAVDRTSNSEMGRLIEAQPVPTDFNLPPFPEWSFPILCALILASCLVVAKMKQWEQSSASGTLAAISWWLWLYLKRDPHLSPWFSWT